MEVGQNIALLRGQEVTYSYLVAGAANVSEANWYCAQSSDAVPGNVLLSLATGGQGITVQNANEIDLMVSVTLSAAQTESLPVGFLHTELWLLLFTAPIPVSAGTLRVDDSLRN